ncbi:MAG: hypothetical protein K6F09_00230 [Clostridiales bacterium]|nr:hypothetical protein [Clostridiales bacterium]
MNKCRCFFRGECAGLMMASFGAGLIAARLIPYSVVIIIVAAVLIVTGIVLYNN